MRRFAPTRILVLPLLICAFALLCALPDAALARNAIRTAFFTAFPSAQGTILATAPSNDAHCGVCHYDFSGAGPRNPYGIAVGLARDSGMTDLQAVQFAATTDVDGDGQIGSVEITDLVNFTNTPTFPGLTAGNVGDTVNIALADIQDHLTPSTGVDTTPPSVLVTAPDGGGNFGANTITPVTWSATDESGIARIDIHMSDDGGATWKQVGMDVGNSGSWNWFVPNLPGPLTRIRVTALDNAGNSGNDASNASFTIAGVTTGVVPTTLRDFELPGTQPFQGGVLDDPATACTACHAGYDQTIEMWHNWRGSMMANAMRDPLYLATLAIAEQQAPAVGDLCLRCHTPGGWQEGRSVDTSAGQLNAKDRQGVQCDYCHRMVNPHYVEGVSPAADLEILNALDGLPLTHANGQFVTDPAPVKRGPYSDAVASHSVLHSPFHRDGGLCGTCHDVSNPVFVKGAGDHEYVAQALDAPHPDGDLRNMFPIERTYSEWTQSAYAAGGVYAPQFAGDRPDGMVSTCQDCHMRDVTGIGASVAGTPTRPDLPLHDLTGGNYFIPDVLPAMWPGEVDATELQAGKARALAMLTLAATLQLTPIQQDGLPGITVRVTNETGHKLPSGYPEGRRIWLNVKAYDASAALVYESGEYDGDTAELGHDADLKIYHAEPGLSTRLASAVGLTAGPSFNFALNDSIYVDNRIPPRGFTNASFLAVQAAPIGHAYADGQYWDDTTYLFPATARTVEVTLWYQSTSKEYVTFLRDMNTTNTIGDEMYAAWEANGRSAPVAMASQTMALDVTGVAGDAPPAVTMLAQNVPNPFNPRTTIRFALAREGDARLRIFDGRGRLVRALVDGRLPAGEHEAVWDGADDTGKPVAAGVYAYVLKAGREELRRKLILVK